MVSTVTRLTAEQVRLVRDWDMSKVRQFLHQRKGMNHDDLIELENQYKLFLLAVAENLGTDIPISEPVDEFWHTHMLFSADYSDMSQALLGCACDHYPLLTEEDHAEALVVYQQLTLPTLERLIGAPPSEKFWPRNRCICYSGGKRSLARHDAAVAC
jgi:hypothetical protein